MSQRNSTIIITYQNQKIANSQGKFESWTITTKSEIKLNNIQMHLKDNKLI